MPPAAPHRHPEGPRDVPDVPGPPAVEAHVRLLPQHPERGAGEAVHRAVRGRVGPRLVTGGERKGERKTKKPERNEDEGLDNNEWTQPNYTKTLKHNPLCAETEADQLKCCFYKTKHLRKQ